MTHELEDKLDKIHSKLNKYNKTYNHIKID